MSAVIESSSPRPTKHPGQSHRDNALEARDSATFSSLRVFSTPEQSQRLAPTPQPVGLVRERIPFGGNSHQSM